MGSARAADVTPDRAWGLRGATAPHGFPRGPTMPARPWGRLAGPDSPPSSVHRQAPGTPTCHSRWTELCDTFPANVTSCLSDEVAPDVDTGVEQTNDVPATNAPDSCFLVSGASPADPKWFWL